MLPRESMTLHSTYPGQKVLELYAVTKGGVYEPCIDAIGKKNQTVLNRADRNIKK